jgi:hypothetical protein
VAPPSPVHQPTSSLTYEFNMGGSDFGDLGSHHGPMPQRVRMFLDGLARQPGDAISMVANTVRRLILNQAEPMGPKPLTP